MSQGYISDGLQADNINSELTRFSIYGGAFKFVTTGTTVTVKVPDYCRRYHVIGWCYTGTPAVADGPISVPLPGTDGVVAAEGSQGGYYITLTRVAGTTSALGGHIYIRGIP